MPSRADFYVGRGTEAEWVGSLAWDAYPDGLPDKIRQATDEQDFRERVGALLNGRADSTTPEEGWPWTWDDSHKTEYSYAFDAKKGKVFASCYGSNWWPASRKEPERTTLKRKAAMFPDMSLRKKISTGDDGSGVLIIE